MDRNITAQPDFEQEDLLYMLQQEDSLPDNHRLIEEQVMEDAIKSGDEQYVRNNIERLFPRYPRLIEASAFKSEEYMAVVTIAISSRFAIAAKATTAESFRLSDLFLKRLAGCRSTEEIIRCRNEAVIAFTQLVQICRDQRDQSGYIGECKQYISDRIFEKISLSDIARNLGVSKGYLASLFAKKEGITIVTYIHREKIRIACNMLKYADRSIAEISNYLKFNSQSYFGKIFKKETGMTPQQYRDAHRPPQF